MSPGAPVADSAARRFGTAADLEAAVGERLGHSGWLTIDQHRIDTFAEATGDHQWIHVDAERAASGPFGATIAHGYLTLSLVPALVASLVDYAGWTTKINYGSDKVRFPAPVLVGSRVRAVVGLTAVRSVATGVLATMQVTVEIEAPDGEPAGKPALIAEILTLLLP